LVDSLLETLGGTLPSIVGALVILILGWLLAVLIRAGIRKLLGWMKLNERVQSGTGKSMDLQNGIATGAFYLILVLAFIAFFENLNLRLVVDPLRSMAEQILAFAPSLVAGIILILIAWVIATFLRAIVTRALGATKIDEKLSDEAGMRPMSRYVGNVVYWLVFLLFLPAILGALEIRGLLDPVEGMVDSVLAMVPNIFAAVVIGLVGWFVARILRDLVRNLLSAAGADRLGEKVGLKESMTLSHLIGLIVYVLVLIPALIAALDALQIESVSGPATTMLGMFLSAIPGIFGAAVILAVAYFIVRFVANLVTSILGGTAFDALPGKLGFGDALTKPTLSELVGKLIIFFGMLFAAVEAANRLGFEKVTELVAMFIQFGGQVLLGIVIIAIGLWIANLVHTAITKAGGSNAGLFAGLARIAILGMVIAMGLRAMGLADEIVHLAFGLTLGAIAVAVALSFGLGGREAAGRQMDHWLRKLRGEG
jgi:hypothetical protein